MNKRKLRKILAAEGLLSSSSRTASAPKALAKVIEDHGLPPRDAMKVADAMVAALVDDVAENLVWGTLETEPEAKGTTSGYWVGQGRMTYRGGLDGPPEYAEAEGEFEYPSPIVYRGGENYDLRDFIKKLQIPAAKGIWSQRFADRLLKENGRLFKAIIAAAVKNAWRTHEGAYQDYSQEFAWDNVGDMPLTDVDYRFGPVKCKYDLDIELVRSGFNLDFTVTCDVTELTVEGNLEEPDYVGYVARYDYDYDY